MQRVVRVKPNHFPVGELWSELRSCVQYNSGETGLLRDTSGSKKLHGALKDAPRVTPRRYRGLDLEVELHDSIYRRRPG